MAFSGAAVMLAAVNQLPPFVRQLRLIGPLAASLRRFLDARGIEIFGAESASQRTNLFYIPPPSERDFADLAPSQRAISFILSWSEEQKAALLSGLENAGEYARVDLGEGAALHYVVSHIYNPVDHCRHAVHLRDFSGALAILDAIPPQYLRDDSSISKIANERQRILLAWAHEGSEDLLLLFSRALAAYFTAVAHDPLDVSQYLKLARFYELLNDPEAAARLDAIPLEHLESLTGGSGFTDRIALRAKQREADPFRYEAAVEHGSQLSLPSSTAPMRILYLLHPRMHYGLDVLYDGLVQTIGSENVIDFPSKPSLHGEADPAYRHYPCCFAHPQHGLTLEEVEAQLRASMFDLILYGDCEGDLPVELAGRILAAAEDVPVVAYDALDEPLLLLEQIEARLKRNISLYFKREMLLHHPYERRILPLPFAFPPLAEEHEELSRSIDFFWAGHRRYGSRRRILYTLEEGMNRSFDAVLEPAQYRDALLRARVGLSMAGAGFDTVRYWELPAHGAMLLSERLPIRIPHDFVDGESAVFFDTPQQLVEKARYYMEHPEEAAAIAQRGKTRFLWHHTTQARARQFLAEVQRAIRKG